jgi:hypothetical protein
MLRVIITGGAGLIGRALSADLMNAGYEVVLLSRNPDRVMGLPPTVRAVRWDGQTATGWGELSDGAAAIVNLAGENLAGEGFFPSRWTAERKQRILQSRLLAGAAVVEAVRGAATKPGVVVQSSAVGYYGPLGDEIVTEAKAPGRDFGAHVCETWEPSTATVEAWGVRRAIIRTGVVLSRSGGALTRLALPFRFFAGGRIGGGRQWVSWIHIADEVAAIRFLVENPEASGAFNLTAPQPLRNADLARAIGRAMRRPSWLPLPGFAFRLAFGEVASVLLEGQRAIPQRLLDLGFRFRFAEAEPALRDLLGR